MATKSKSLQTAVAKEAKQAESDARTGDVTTRKQTKTMWERQTAGEDLPTYARRSQPPE